MVGSVFNKVVSVLDGGFCFSSIISQFTVFADEATYVVWC